MAGLDLRCKTEYFLRTTKIEIFQRHQYAPGRQGPCIMIAAFNFIPWIMFIRSQVRFRNKSSEALRYSR